MTPSPVPRTVEWVGDLDGHVSLIDQTRLPEELVMLQCSDAGSVRSAIQCLAVRGAPAIGIAAAMGAVLEVRAYGGSDGEGLLARLDKVCDWLADARPTAVNLRWALDRMRRFAASLGESDVGKIKTALLAEARRIRDEDAAMCRAIGNVGADLITEGCGVLTHCNAGGLATSEFGTALAPLYTANACGRRFRVYASETRPLLQGSRLTAWELNRAGINVTVLCDSMVAALMNEGVVDLVITGADRIAANGDVANKIGTYGLALLARAHDIPLYVAAPSSTFDLGTAEGGSIPIEHRSPDEIRCGFGRLTAPAEVDCYSPAFDVTPAPLIQGLIMELGLIEPVNRSEIATILTPPGGDSGGCGDTRSGR